MGVGHDGGADGCNGLVGRPVGQSYFLADSPCGRSQIEKLGQPQPLYTAQAALVDPAPAEVMEGITASAATPPSFLKFVVLSSAATGTKALMVFHHFPSK